MNSALNLLSVGITDLCHYIWLQLFALFNKGFHSLAQAGLKLTMLSTQPGFKLSAILLPRSPECWCHRGKAATPGIHFFFNSCLAKPHKEKRKCVLNICLKACLSISDAPRVLAVGTAAFPHRFLLPVSDPNQWTISSPNRKLLSLACRVVQSSLPVASCPFHAFCFRCESHSFRGWSGMTKRPLLH